MGPGALFAASPQKPAETSSRALLCDPALKALFTPGRPQLGHYEVCTSAKPLSVALLQLGKVQWRVEALPPLDAFGAAGAYDKSALSSLYGGRRVSVARGWIEANGRLDSLTLISPYPDRTLRRLVPGTLIIRFIICCT
jgi:hypothetical protein